MWPTAISLTAILALAVTQDQNDTYDYGQDMCYPDAGDSGYNLEAPCNAVFNIAEECAAGNPMSPSMPDCDSEGNTECSYAFNNATQRACICGSQMFDQLKGCKACYFAHGIGPYEWDGSWPKDIDALSSSYCAVKSEPTKGFGDILVDAESSGDGETQPSSSWSDSTNGKTDPALYFTPAVTGTEGYHVAVRTDMPSSDWSSGSSIRISYSTSGGYFVPTATPNNKAASKTTDASSSTGASSSTNEAVSSQSDGASGSGAKASATMGGMGIQQTVPIAGLLVLAAGAIIV